MSLALPEPIAAYFVADKRADAEALARCFVDDAIVQDEGRAYQGIAAITKWSAGAKEKYHHTVEPLDVIDRDGKTVVIGKVSGDFPNSPVTLEHIFELEGQKIASLELR